MVKILFYIFLAIASSAFINLIITLSTSGLTNTGDVVINILIILVSGIAIFFCIKNWK